MSDKSAVKNLEQLLDVLQSVLLVNPKDAWKRVRLGQTYQKLGRLEESLDAFRRAIKDQPTYAEGHAGLGVALAEKGNWPEAEASLREALKLKPELVDAHVELAQGYARLGQFDKASQEFSAALTLKPDMVSLLRKAAEVAVKSRRFDEATQFLIRAREQTAEDPDVLLALGLSRAEVGQLAEAREALDVYVGLANPVEKPAEAWTTLARACQAVGDLPAAVIAHERALKLLVSDVPTHLAAGQAYAQLGEHESAVRLLERATILAPDKSQAASDAWDGLGLSLLALGRFEASLAALGRAVEIRPQHAVLHIGLAKAHLGLGRDQNAADALEQALRLDGTNTEALLLLAIAYKRLDRAPDATAALRRAVEAKPGDASLRFELAAHHQAIGQLPQAFAVFREAAARKPGYVEAHLRAAICATELEQLRDAVREYEAAIEAAPERPEAHRGLGIVQRRLGDHAAAIPALLSATRLDASDGEAFYWLADSRGVLGKRDDALSDIRQAIRRRPEDPAVHSLFGMLLVQENRHRDAIEALETSLKLAPDVPEVLYQLGICHRTLGKLDAAETAFVRVQKLLPKDARIRDALGHLYLQLGRHEEALDTLEEADRLRPGNVETLRALGLAYLLFDSPREAQRTLEKALTIGPPVALTHLHHARALLKLGRTPDGRRELLEAVKLEPTLAEAHFDLGVVLARAGELESAVTHLEEATRGLTDPADVYAELARVRRTRGDVHEALLAFKQRLRARPNDADAHFGLAETLVFASRDVEAVEPQQMGLRLEPGRPGASRALGEMFTRLGRHDEAVAPLEAAVLLEPTDPKLLALLAACYERAVETEREVALLVRAVAASPKDAALLRRLGLAHRKLAQGSSGNVDVAAQKAAIAALTMALSLDGTLVDLHAPLGELHRSAARLALKAADNAEAATEFGLARDTIRDDAELCVEHAHALQALGRPADLAAAASAALRATEIAPDRADIWHLLAELSDATKNPGQASVAYERVTKLQPDRLSAQVGLGLAKVALGDMAGAIDPLTRAVALDPENMPALGQLAAAHRHEKHFAPARDVYLRLAKLRPLDTEPLRGLSACQVTLGEDEAALLSLTTLARLAPDDLKVLESVAQCQERLGQLEDSVESYEQLLDIEPERLPARRAVTLSYARLGRHDDVVRGAKPVLRAKPDDQEVLLVLAQAHTHRTRWADAADAAGELVRITTPAVPIHLDGLRVLAEAEVALGKDELAIATYERAVSLPEPPPAALQQQLIQRLDELTRVRAQKLEARGDHASALPLYERARQLVPTDPIAPLAVARCLHAVGQPQRALEVLRETLRAHPQHGPSWLLLGRLYAEGGYGREAADAFRKAVAEAPRSFEGLSGLGFAAAELGLVDEAIDALTKAANEPSDDPQVMVRVKTKLGALYDSSGRGEEAIRSLLELREIRGLSVDEHRRLGLLCAAANRHADAVDPLTAALGSTPTDPALLEPLTLALESLGRDAEVTRYFVRLRDAVPGHANVSSRLGFAYARLGQHVEAAAAFELARAKESMEGGVGVAVLNGLIAAYQALGNEPARVASLEALVTLSPHDLAAHRTLGQAHDSAGRFEDAIRLFTRTDDLSRGADLELRKRLGELHLARLDRPGSSSAERAEDLAKSRRFAAEDAELLFSVARAYAAGAAGQFNREAVATTREVLVLAPTNVEAALLLGTVLARDGDARGAAEAFELALKQRLDAIDGLVGAGLAYLSLGRSEDAVTMLRRAIRIAPDHLEAQSQLAHTLRALGRGADAAASYAEVVRIAPSDVVAWRALGDLYLELNEPREAVAALEQLVLLRPDDGSALLALATASERLGKPTDQLGALERAYRALPDDPSAASRYGFALGASGAFDPAIQVLTRAHHLNTNDAQVRQKLVELLGNRAGTAESAGDATSAQADFAVAVQLAPDLVPLRLGLARSFRSLGKAHEALSAAQEATTRAPEHAGAWLLLGEICAALAHEAQAVEAFTRAVRYDEGSLAARVGLAHALVRTGDPEGAVGHFTRAVEQHPADATDLSLSAVLDKVQAELARLHQVAGRSAQAAAALTSLQSLRPLTAEESRRHGMLAYELGDSTTCAFALSAARPTFADDADLLFALGSAHVQLEQFEPAVDVLTPLAVLRPNDPKTASMLGLSLTKLQRWDEAAEALRRAITLDPRSQILHDQRIVALEQAGRTADRLGALELAARTFSDDARVARLVALALADANRDGAETIAALERARSLDVQAADVTPKLAALYFAQAQQHLAAGQPSRAIASARSCLTLATDPTESAIFVADLLSQQGEHAEAASLYERALQVRLDAVDAMFGAARSYVALGRIDDAVGSLRRAGRIDPSRVDVFRLLAQTLAGIAQTGGQQEDALMAVGEVLRLTPDDADFLLLRGRLAALVGRNEEAQTALTFALGLRPGDATILLELSGVQSKLGLGGASLEAAEQLVRATPSDARAQRRLGDAYAGVGRTDDAIATLERALALTPPGDPSIASTADVLGKLVFARAVQFQSSGELPRASQDYERAANLLASDPEPCLALARTFGQLGRLQDALAASQKALSRREDHVLSWVLLGEIQGQLGLVEPAASSFAAALRFDRNCFPALLGLGLTSTSLGRTREAEDALSQAISLQPNTPEVHAAHARLIAPLGRTAEAIQSWQRVASLRVLTGEEQRILGGLHSAAGDTSNAASALEQAVAGGAANLDALLELAAAYQGQNRLDDAIAALEKITRVEPAHLAANARLGTCYAILGRHEDAVRALSLARRVEPPSASVLEQLTDCLLQLGRKLEAASTLAARSALSPNDASWLVRLAGALADVERDDEAVAAYERALTLPNAPANTLERLTLLHQSIGDRLGRKGQHDAAIARYTQSITIDPSRCEPRLLLAKVLVEAGRSEEALSAAHGALSADSSSLEAAELLGNLYFQHNLFAESVQVFEFALETKPDVFSLAFGLGRAFCWVESPTHFADAIRPLRRAIELDPNHLESKRLLARAVEASLPEVVSDLSTQGAVHLEPAVVAWQSVIAQEPGDAEANQHLGLLLIEQGKFKAATEALARARDGLPEDLAILLPLAFAYESIERFSDAILPLAAAVRLRPDDPELVYRHGRALAELGRNREATDVLVRAIQLAAGPARLELRLEVLERLAGVYEALGRKPEALESLEAALQGAPKNVRLLRRTGLARIATGAVEVGADLLERAQALEPSPETAQTLLELCRNEAKRALDANNLADAQPWLARALAIDSDDTDLAVAYARCLDADGRGEEAWSFAAAILEVQPQHLDAAMFVSSKFSQAGYHDRAAAALAGALPKYPDNVPLLLALGDAYLACGRRADGISLLERSLQLDPHLQGVAPRLGKILVELERLPEAATTLERAVAEQPEDGSLHELLSSVRQSTGRFDKAAASYQRVIDLGRRDAPAYLHLGTLLEQAGQAEPAWRAVHQAFLLEPRDIHIIRRLGVMTHTLGRTEEAIQWFQVGLGVSPRDPQLHYELAVCFLALGRRVDGMAEYEIVCQLDNALATKLYYALGGR